MGTHFGMEFHISFYILAKIQKITIQSFETSFEKILFLPHDYGYHPLFLQYDEIHDYRYLFVSQSIWNETEAHVLHQYVFENITDVYYKQFEHKIFIINSFQQ